MESIRTHPERKAEIIESLSHQVNATRELLGKAEELSALNPAEAIQGINELMEAVQANFPPETLQKYEEVLTIKSKLTALEQQNDISDYEASIKDSPIDFDEVDTVLMDNQEMDLTVRLEELLDDEEVKYLSIVDKGLNSLKFKAYSQQVGTEEFPNLAEAQDRFDPTDIIQTETDAFSTIFVVKDSAWIKSGRPLNHYGTYVARTNNIYINESAYNNLEKRVGTITHERTHNLLDGIESHNVVDPSKVLSRQINQVKKHAGRQPRVLAESIAERFSTADFLKTLIDGTRNELLADFASSERNTMNVASTDEKLMSLIFPEDADNIAISHQLGSLSTAGLHLSKTIALLKELPKTLTECGLPEQATQCEGLATKFMAMIRDMVKEARKQAKLANALGENAIKDRTALLYVLKPSQYRHIGTYIEAKYGTREIMNNKTSLSDVESNKGDER